MSFFRNVKEFFHNVTTSDHYAQYNNNNKKNPAQNSPSTRHGNIGSNNGSQLSFQNNASSVSLVGHSRPSTSSNNNNKNNTSVYGEANASKSNTAIPYRPGMRSQLHNDSQIELRNYENGQAVRDVDETWDKIDDWLENEFPELGDDMENGATANDLNAFENDLGITLPSCFRDSYQIHDGQVSMGKTRGLIFTYPLMDLETIAAETNIWRRVYERFEKKEPSVINSAFGLQKSCPPGFINEIYYDPLWIPFVKDNVGNNIAIDLNPNESGKWGQVILFGRDYNTKFVVADSFSEFLSNLSDELENGNYEIDEDEDLNFISNGRSYNYFDVLKAKSIARAKKLDSNYNINDKKVNDADLLVKKQRNNNNSNVGGINIKKSESSLNDTSNEANENLPNETLISPVYPNAGKRDFTPSKENIATNDSFLIDDDVADNEKMTETEILPVQEEEIIDAKESVEEPAQEPVNELGEEPAQEPAREPAQEPSQEPAQEPSQEPAQEPSQEPAQEPSQEPAQEPIEEPVEQPIEQPVEQSVDGSEANSEADETEEGDVTIETADLDADSESNPVKTTTAKKNKKNKKKKGKK